MTTHFDFIVIGGGSGGIASAQRAAHYGAKVLLIESAELGGTCVNVGCVPKKVMWSASQINETLALAKDYGFQIQPAGFDWSRLKQSRDAYVSRLNAIYGRNLDHSGITLIRGIAQFISAHSIVVNGHKFHSDHILIASGGRPSVPDIAGAELGITSDGFFELLHQPKKILVIGAGYIATELAGLMHGLGSEVSMLLRKDKLLRTFDHDIYEMVMAQMQQNGIKIMTNITLQSLVKENDSLGYRHKEGDQAEQHKDGFDCIIWAIGRHANTTHLNLQVTDIAVDSRGHIQTDAFQNSSVQGIYAVGDVTCRAPLTPVAIAAGRKLADRLFGDYPDAKLDYENIPTVIFSHPPIGSTGLSEAEARAKYADDDIKIYKNQFTDLRYAVAEHKPRTLVKLITQGATEHIVGCHVVGHAADEMIQGFAVAIKMGATKQDFDNTVAIHPTASEELVTLR